MLKLKYKKSQNNKPFKKCIHFKNRLMKAKKIKWKTNMKNKTN